MDGTKVKTTSLRIGNATQSNTGDFLQLGICYRGENVKDCHKAQLEPNHSFQIEGKIKTYNI